MVQYYKTSKKVGAEIKVEYWHGESDRAGFLFNTHDFIIAIGTKKPRNIPTEQIKEF